MTVNSTTPANRFGPTRGKIIVGACIAALIAGLAVDTTAVHIGSGEDLRQQAFSPDAYGKAQFPRIHDIVIDRAADAVVLSEELASNKAAAIESYGRISGAFPVLATKFTGTVGDESSGIFNVAVEGMPEGTQIRVQTGPAINGTELRDIPGDIAFGEFTNQIEYQNAGAGINRAMATQVLSGLDRETLPGQTVTVVGVFTLINPASWLVTPVEFEVQP